MWQVVGIRQFGSPELRFEQFFKFRSINSLSSYSIHHIEEIRAYVGTVLNQ